MAASWFIKQIYFSSFIASASNCNSLVFAP